MWRQTRTTSFKRLLKKCFKDSTDWSNRYSKFYRKSSVFSCQSTSEATWNARQWMPKISETKKASGGSSKTGNAANSMSPQRDSFSWTAMIFQHTKCGKSRKALRIYEEMREWGVKPNSYTFVAVLKACSALQDLESAQRVHAEVVESGFESDVYVGTMLIDAYGKCGSLVQARLVFEKIPYRDVVSWNAMIWGYVQMDNGDEAMKLYARMQQEGLAPDNRTFVGALKACSTLAELARGNDVDGEHVRNRCLEQVRAIHSKVVTHGSELSLFIGNMLMDAYTKCGSLVDARSFFEKMPTRDVVSWNTMILGYAQLEDCEGALQLYARMQQDCVVPDARTFVGVVKVCSRLVVSEGRNQVDGKCVKQWCLEQVRAIHSQVVKGGSEVAAFLGTMLVHVYAKCGCLVDARCIFENLPHRDVVSWNAMILGYAQIEEGDEALTLYRRMQQEGIVPSDRTFVSALKACCSLAAFEEAIEGDAGCVKMRCLQQVRNIHAQVVKHGSESAVFVGNMLVDVYAKCGSLVDARCVFEQMPHRDVVSWNVMLLGYAQGGDGAEVLQLYARMQQKGVVSDARTFVAVLKACSAVTGLERGKEIHAEILKIGYKATELFVPTTLIDMYCKCGSMENARQVFDGLSKRNIVTWSALIAGYANQGESEMVFDLLERMRLEGLQPNGTIFLSLLTVCSHAGLLDKGQKYFDAMSRDYGITPNVAHYTCLVDLLCRAGHLDKAMAIVKTMPVQPDIAVWQTLLSACRKWGKVELGQQAYEGALKFDKNDAAAYVLMSNIYAAADMAENASEVQVRCLKTGTLKQRGQSWWTDMCGIVHAFVVGDREHPRILEICASVQNLDAKMEEEAFVPYFSSVFKNILDDKEQGTSHGHSEELSVASALLDTPYTDSASNSGRMCRTNKTGAMTL